jgi:hypothetical protein
MFKSPNTPSGHYRLIKATKEGEDRLIQYTIAGVSILASFLDISD